MPRPANTAELISAVLDGDHGPRPHEFTATSAFWLHHTTRLSGGPATYRNHYLLLRCGGSFGACAFSAGELHPDICAQASGHTLEELLTRPEPPMQIAALDAYLSEVRPHRDAPGAEPVPLPPGSPDTRARARDTTIAALADITPGTKVALIGVVDPLVAAIRDRGGLCLPCDLDLRTTRWGDPIATDMDQVLGAADSVIATGMTLGNRTFDRLLAHCRDHDTPLVVYGQTGSAAARAFLGAGVTALAAEPFPFSQFSAEETTLYRYRV